MTLHRDASDRLTAAFDCDAADYPRLVQRLVERFELQATGPAVRGIDETFQEFAHGALRVVLEWDVWMGFQAVAGSRAAEPLVERIAAFLAA